MPRDAPLWGHGSGTSRLHLPRTIRLVLRTSLAGSGRTMFSVFFAPLSGVSIQALFPICMRFFSCGEFGYRHFFCMLKSRIYVLVISSIPQPTLDLSELQPVLRAGRCAHTGVHELPDQRGQVETAIDPVLRLGKIAVAVLGKIEVVVSTCDRGLGIGDEDVDPVQWLQGSLDAAQTGNAHAGLRQSA